jgi:hypothetical protein
MEQVVAAPGAEVRSDLDLAVTQAELGVDPAIGNDLRLDCSSSQQRCKQRWTDPAKAECICHRSRP